MTDPDRASSLRATQARIAAAALAAGRDPTSIALVAASKQQAWDRIEPILAAGQTRFGENRVQEAMTRWGERRAGLTLHLIGPLQTNKAREAVELFDVIETLDRPRLAQALAEAIARSGHAPSLYVQVNTGEEPQKSGVAPREADGFIAVCRKDYGLVIDGLMCIPPADEPAGLHFALLGKIARRNGLERLSMGMSGDFETAIAFGATSVRLGEAVFGPRANPAA